MRRPPCDTARTSPTPGAPTGRACHQCGGRVRGHQGRGTPPPVWRSPARCRAAETRRSSPVPTPRRQVRTPKRDRTPTRRATTTHRLAPTCRYRRSVAPPARAGWSLCRHTSRPRRHRETGRSPVLRAGRHRGRCGSSPLGPQGHQGSAIGRRSGKPTSPQRSGPRCCAPAEAPRLLGARKAPLPEWVPPFPGREGGLGGLGPFSEERPARRRLGRAVDHPRRHAPPAPATSPRPASHVPVPDHGGPAARRAPPRHGQGLAVRGPATPPAPSPRYPRVPSRAGTEVPRRANGPAHREHPSPSRRRAQQPSSPPPTPPVPPRPRRPAVPLRRRPVRDRPVPARSSAIARDRSPRDPGSPATTTPSLGRHPQGARVPPRSVVGAHRAARRRSPQSPRLPLRTPWRHPVRHQSAPQRGSDPAQFAAQRLRRLRPICQNHRATRRHETQGGSATTPPAPRVGPSASPPRRTMPPPTQWASIHRRTPLGRRVRAQPTSRDRSCP